MQGAIPAYHMGAGFHIKRSRSLLGLDFGASSIKVVELTEAGGEITLTGFDSVPVREDSAQALEELLSRGGYSTRRVALAVGGRSVCVRYTHFPKMPASEMVEAVRLEADRLLPFEDTEITLDCQELEPSSTDSEGEAVPVLVAACRTEFVEERVNAVVDAGFTPALVDVDLFGLVNAWALDTREDRPSAVALVDVGGSRTGVVLVEDGTPRFTREFEQGSASAASKPSQAPSASFDGVGETSELDALAREIALSVEYAEHNEGIEVEEILLTGGGALLDGLAVRIAEESRRPVELWNPMASMAIDPERLSPMELGDRGPTFTVALGLAARVLSS